MTSYRLMDGVAGRPGIGSSGTTPPAATTAFGGATYCVGFCFKVTSAAWLEGFWWFVCASGSQSAVAQKFVLWCANWNGSGGATIIPAATVTSGPLSPGFNFIPLATPVPLTIGWTYQVATGFNSTNGIPFTNAQFGVGNPYAAGITNGPLTGFSDQGASNPDPFGLPQCGDTRAGTDPAVNWPNGAAGSYNGWLDVQVTDKAPANATYRLFPSIEGFGTGVEPDDQVITDTDGFTIGNTFALSVPCTMLRLWWYSLQGSGLLPARVGVWDVQNQAEIPGTDNASPVWHAEGGGAGAAGGGWVYVDYTTSGVILPAGRNMIVAAWSPGGIGVGNQWRGVSLPFWGTGGTGGGAINVGANGMNYGIISAPSTASGVPLQGGFNGPGNPWAFPGSWNNPENDWTDIEVQPAGSGTTWPVELDSHGIYSTAISTEGPALGTGYIR